MNPRGTEMLSTVPAHCISSLRKGTTIVAPTTKDPIETNQEMAHLQQRATLISKQVLRALGQPASLLMVQVRLLWEDHYRANVFIGAEVTSSTVAHSYFLVTDPGGTILTSAPPITRQY